jgi:iron complex transport system substrate-binding protein
MPMIHGAGVIISAGRGFSPRKESGQVIRGGLRRLLTSLLIAIGLGFAWGLPGAGLAAPNPPAPSPTDAPCTDGLRIISLAPNITELVYSLGHGDCLVGVTDYCRHPAEAAHKPRVGGLHNPSLEGILALRPTLVLHLPAHQSLADGLRKNRIECINIRSEVLDDIYAALGLLGSRLGRTEQARHIEAQIRADLDRVRRRTEPLGRKRVLMIVSHAPGSLRDLYAAGRGNFLDELITLAGGENLLEKSALGYPILSREYLLTASPDVVIDCQYTAPAASAADAQPDFLRRLWLDFYDKRPGSIPRIEFLNDPRHTVPGPSVARSVEALARLIHGADFAPPEAPPAAPEVSPCPKGERP